MIKTIQDVTRRLVHEYQPDRIILFGSCVTGKSRRDSDIDLLIVKDTDKRPLERRVEVEGILSDRAMPLDIFVYTPAELRSLYFLGSPFVEEVIEKGRVLYMRKAVQEWVKDVIEELESAIILYDHGKYRGACYHSQQCVEKGLKAMILEKGRKPARVHDIVELLSKVEKLGHKQIMSIDEAVYLNSIYKGRYPTEEGLLPQGDPAKGDAERAVSVAKSLIEKLERL